MSPRYASTIHNCIASFNHPENKQYFAEVYNFIRTREQFRQDEEETYFEIELPNGIRQDIDPYSVLSLLRYRNFDDNLFSFVKMKMLAKYAKHYADVHNDVEASERDILMHGWHGE